MKVPSLLVSLSLKHVVSVQTSGWLKSRGKRPLECREVLPLPLSWLALNNDLPSDLDGWHSGLNAWLSCLRNRPCMEFRDACR